MTTDPRAPTPATAAPLGEAARPPDQPAVPHPRWARGAKWLAGFGALAIAGYALILFTDYEPGAPDHDQVPASVRASPGGYRSFHFWHSGYHGGK